MSLTMMQIREDKEAMERLVAVDVLQPMKQWTQALHAAQVWSCNHSLKRCH